MVDGPALSAPLRAAIIGLGNIAWMYDSKRHQNLTHHSTYAADPRTTLIAGFDTEEAKRTGFTSDTGIDSAPTLTDLLAQKPDIVSICYPNALHAAHLRACLEAGVPMIWVEKPATTSTADTRDLIALQTQGKSRVLVGFQRRYQQAYQRLSALVADRTLGELKGISVTCSRGLETNGVHLVDLVFFLMGAGAKYSLRGVSKDRESPSFILDFENGVPCVVTGLALDHHSIDVTAHFADGRASVLYGGATEVRERRIENPLYPGYFRLKREASDERSDDELKADALGVFPRMRDDLIAADAEGREPKSSLKTSLDAQAVVEHVLAEAAR